MARNPLKPLRVSIKDPESPRMKALNGGASASGTLYTYPDNFRAYKGLIAAQYSGAKVRVISDPPDFVLGKTNKTVQFLAKFPMGKVPAFESSDGKNLFESNAIAFYLANDQLRGVSIEDQGFVLQWISFADHELLPPVSAWVFPFMGLMDLKRSSIAQARQDCQRVLQGMEEHLKTRTFLVNDEVTLGDICCMCNLLHPFKWVFEPAFRSQFPNLMRWFMAMVNEPQVKKVIGEVELCESEARYDAKKIAELSRTVGLSPRKLPKKLRQRSVEETSFCKSHISPRKFKRAMTIPDDSDDDDIQIEVGSGRRPRVVGFSASASSTPRHAPMQRPTALPRSPRRNHLASASPLAACLQPTFKPAFSIETLKCVYESDDVDAVLPYIKNNFDVDMYSIWLSEYRYPKDLGVMFQSEGLIRSMFQRLDGLRPQVFSIMGLFGRSRGAQIQGLWICKGKRPPLEVDPQWQLDHDNFEWFQLSLGEEQTTEYIKEFLYHKEDQMRYKPSRTGAPMAAMTLYSATIFK